MMKKKVKRVRTVQTNSRREWWVVRRTITLSEDHQRPVSTGIHSTGIHYAVAVGGTAPTGPTQWGPYLSPAEAEEKAADLAMSAAMEHDDSVEQTVIIEQRYRTEANFYD